MGQKPFAFFDFDHTILDADAGPRFGRHLFLYKREAIKNDGSKATRAAASGALWLRYTPFVAWMSVQSALYTVGARRRSSIVRTAYRGLKGVPVAVFQEQLKEFVRHEVPPLLFPEMIAEINRHQKNGVRCVIVTTGMETLVKAALEFLPPGIELIGCRLLEKNGRMTGRVEGPLYGADKANIMRAYCAASGVDLADCYAYSDHWSDLEMLQAVGHPVAVNPRGHLRRHAQRQGWRILDPKPRE